MIDYLGHNLCIFQMIKNRNTKYYCNKCNIIYYNILDYGCDGANVYLVSRLNSTERSISNKNLTCPEMIIKQIIE